MVTKTINLLNRLTLVILSIILITIIYSKYIQKSSVVKLGKYGILIVVSNSMEPTIQEGELIMIKENSQYEIGDIVTYLDSYDMLITHRIHQIDEYSFLAKGDNNAIVDPNTSMNKIEGKVIYHSQFWGHFIQHYFKFVILFYCTVLVIFYVKQKLKKEKKHEK